MALNLLNSGNLEQLALKGLKLIVEQATEVNANKHLLVLNMLLIKYFMHDVNCDVNYCVYTLRRPAHPSICY